PFPQKDYYSLLAFFHGFQRYGVRSPESVAQASLRPIVSKEEQARQKEIIAAHQNRIADLVAQMKEIEDRLAPQLQGGERDDFKFEQNRLAIVKKHVPEHVSQDVYVQYQSLTKEKVKLEKSPPPAAAMALCVTEIGRTPRETFVLLRGNPRNKGP